MTTTLSSKNYANTSVGDFSFSGISASEVDVVNGVGSVASFTSSTGDPFLFGSATELGYGWSGFGMSVSSPDGLGDSETVTISSDVTMSNGALLTSIDTSFQLDRLSGDGHFHAVEQAFDDNNVLLGTQVFDSGATIGSTITPGPVVLTHGVAHAHIVLTVTETAQTAGSTIGVSILEQLFGETHGPPPAALGDYVWFDSNNDGLQDNGETGVSGVTVDLLSSTNTVLATTTTDSTGHYLFSGLAAGSYSVLFVTPPGTYHFTTANVGGDRSIDSNADVTTGQSGLVTLAAGQTDLTIDAGLVLNSQQPSFALGDYVWFDTNGDGKQAASESGVSGVSVTLLDGTGAPLGPTTVTDSSGFYHFTNLAAGTYEVKFIAPSGDTFTTQNAAGSTTSNDSNANVSTGVTGPIVLSSANPTDNTIDAGLVALPPRNTAALGDYVWLDTNGDGKQAGSELGVSGVTVTLLNGSGVPLGPTTTTDASGFYHFTNLAAGTYEVKFTAPSGDTFTTQNASGSTTSNDSNPNVSTGVTGQIILGVGQTDNTIDAGLVVIPPPNTAALGDYVWCDTNADGKQTSGELGVSGVTVTLLNGSGAPLGPTTTTDASGFYHFTNLAAGTYEVKFTAPSGKAFTTQTVSGSTTANDSNPNTSTGVTGQIVLAAGQTDNTIDAGLVVVPPPNTAALGDYVWCDTNADGKQSTGELGVSGVTVTLLNGSGAALGPTTTTDASGFYHFTNLAAGTYEVKFTAPSGKVFTTQTVSGATTATDSNPNASTGVTGQITLAAGQTDNTIDAGLISKPGISINKVPGDMVINTCSLETYTFNVTNTGSTPITNVVLKDNIGSASNPDYITPSAVKSGSYNVGDTNSNNKLDVGETWKYTVTNAPIENSPGSCGTVSHTCSGSDLGAGKTAWFSCNFTPTNTSNGTCYVFHDVSCKLSGGSSGGYNVDCPDAEIRFSSSCTQATTTYDTGR